jgi:hypothetical protein
MNVWRDNAHGATTFDFAPRQYEATVHQLEALRRRRFRRAGTTSPFEGLHRPPPSHRLDVRSWSAMARTCLTLTGVVDATAIRALRRAIDRAQRKGHEVSLDVSGIVAIAHGSREDLIALAYRVALASES